MRHHPCFPNARAMRTVLGPLAACLLVAAAGVGQAQAPATAAAAATDAGPANVYAAGADVRQAGPVRGDFVAAGGKVVVDQPVGGDASVAGGAVSVRSPVGEDLRAVGGDVSIESSVGGELLATGAHIDVAATASVAGGASLYGGNVIVKGRIGGPLDVTAQKVTIDGEVAGDARLVAGQVELGPRARLAGALRYASPNALKQSATAAIAGEVRRDASTGPPMMSGRFDGRQRDWAWHRSMQVPFWAGGLLSFLGLLACAVLFLLVLPVFGEGAAQRVQRTPGRAAAIGVGTAILLPLLAVLLFVSLLGIPLGMAVLMLYPVLLLVGFLVGVLFLARLAATGLRSRPPSTFAATVGYFALALLAVLLAARLPMVGWLLLVALGIVGTGAAALELYERRLRPPRPADGGPAADARA